MASRVAAAKVDGTVTDHGRDGALDPRLVMLSLEEVIPKDRTLVVDAGHHMSFSCRYLSVPDPGSFLLPAEGGAIGGSMGVALGAAVGRPDRLTVLEIGDGALMISLGDLDTTVRYQLPTLVLVANDSALGAEVHYLQLHNLPDRIARFVNPSFEAVARGLGADGATVNSLDDIRGLARRFGVRGQARYRPRDRSRAHSGAEDPRRSRNRFGPVR